MKTAIAIPLKKSRKIKINVFLRGSCFKRGCFLLGQKKGGSCLPPERIFMMCIIYQKFQKEAAAGVSVLVPGFMAFWNVVTAVCRLRYAVSTVSLSAVELS